MVLNTFSYTGGFSVYAGIGGAKEIHSVDVSEPAIEICNHNINLNGITNHHSFVADTFEFLKEKKNIYDVIILDPPAFAKSRSSKHNGAMAYKRLNALAIKNIKANGIIFTFSCSGAVYQSPGTLESILQSASVLAKRDCRIIQKLNAASDHVYLPSFPETQYLSGFAVYVT